MAHASPHMLACSSISPVGNSNWQIGHWVQERRALSGEHSHEMAGGKEREVGSGCSKVSPQVAACWGRTAMLKKSAQMGHCPLSWMGLPWAWGRDRSFCSVFAVLLLFSFELELEKSPLSCPSCIFCLFVLCMPLPMLFWFSGLDSSRSV